MERYMSSKLSHICRINRQVADQFRRTYRVTQYCGEFCVGPSDVESRPLRVRVSIDMDMDCDQAYSVLYALRRVGFAEIVPSTDEADAAQEEGGC
jgi:hypothetical protein